jgi:nitrogen fixation NifU-like protein
MSEASAEALYQRAIIDLARKAETMPLLAAPAVRVTVDNPLCGDRVILDLTLDQEGRVQEVGSSCSSVLRRSSRVRARPSALATRSCADLTSPRLICG